MPSGEAWCACGLRSAQFVRVDLGRVVCRGRLGLDELYVTAWQDDHDFTINSRACEAVLGGYDLEVEV